MKIAIINRHPDDVIGGSEIQSAGIASRLTNRGHEVFYIAPSGDSQKNYQTNYRVLPVEAKAKSIADAVLKFNPDIVYWRINKYHFHDAARDISKHKIPIVFAISHLNDTKYFSKLAKMKSGLIPFLKGVKQGLLNVYNHRGFKYVDGVTSLNPEFLGKLPIQNQCFVPNTISEEAIEFSWPRPYVVWVSNIKLAKRPELFTKLAEELSQTNVDFLMIGKIHDGHYEWIADKTKTPSNFHYIGPKSLEEVNGIIEQSEFLIHTCRPEGFGSVFLQAWLKSKPTVTYEFDPGSFIENNDIGGSADADWDTFVKMTNHFIKDNAARKAAGARAHAFALETFSAEKATDTLEDFLNNIVQQRSK